MGTIIIAGHDCCMLQYYFDKMREFILLAMSYKGPSFLKIEVNIGTINYSEIPYSVV